MIKNILGDLCLFLDDGSFVRYTDRQGLGYYSNIGEEIWFKKIRLHHQLNFSNSKKTLLTLSQDIRREGKDLVDYPNFHEIDILTGKELKRFSTYENKKFIFENYLDLSNIVLRPLVDRGRPFYDTLHQFVHANSIYQLPDSYEAPVLDVFKSAGYIFTIAEEGFFLLSKDFKKIVWHEDLSEIIGGMSHDSQVLKNGEILFYSNEGLKGYPEQASMHLYNPLTKDLKNVFPLEFKSPKKFSFFGLTLELSPKLATYHAECCGGVQLTSKGILYSVNSKEEGGVSYLVDYEGRLLYRSPFPLMDATKKMPGYFQQIKEVDLAKFLRNHKL